MKHRPGSRPVANALKPLSQRISNSFGCHENNVRKRNPNAFFFGL